MFQNHLEGLLKQVLPHPQSLWFVRDPWLGPCSLQALVEGPAVVFLVLHHPSWPWFNRPRRCLLLPGSVPDTVQ